MSNHLIVNSGMEATLNKQMDKLLKYLMLLLVTTFSLTFTACGGDDDEPEPTNPVAPNVPASADFFFGTWQSNTYEGWYAWWYTHTYEFNKDFTYTETTIQEKSHYTNTIECVGSWSYKNGILKLAYTEYYNGKYEGTGTADMPCIYDKRTEKLIFNNYTDVQYSRVSDTE